MIIQRGKLFGGTVPPNNTLFGGTPDFVKPYLISMKSCFYCFNNLSKFKGKLFGPLRDDFKSPIYILIENMLYLLQHSVPSNYDVKTSKLPNTSMSLHIIPPNPTT